MVVYKLSNFYKSHFKVFLLLVFLALAILAWSNRFIQDDAFISLRYADNFVHGKGLVWNQGERVEGYTNFLWTMILCIPLALNLDPVKFSFALGLGLFELSLYFAWRLANNLLQSKHQATLVVLFLGTNHSFSSYATSGMETELQTCLFLACMFLLFETTRAEPTGGTIVANRPTTKLLLLSFLLSLAVLTRLDSLLIVLVVVAAVLLDIFRRGEPAGRKILQALYLVAPLALIVGVWFIWKIGFYGSVLPNTFFVKVATLHSFKHGIIYVYLFFLSYWLVLFPFLYLIFAKRLFHKHNRAWLVLAVITALWLAYVITVGGDFMEFRFIVPVLPFVFLQIVWLIFVQMRSVKLQIVMVMLVLAGSLHHALTFTNPSLRYYDIESTKGLAALLTQERTDWIGVGKVLGDSFNHDANVSIATTAAGAIPFYSRLTTVDILGLNDRWVARHGEIVPFKPGHQRRAPLSYLIERKVNLLIGHPQMIPINSSPSEMPLYDLYFYVKITKDDSLPATSRIIEIPINASYKLRVLYLVEYPLVDAAIKRNSWVTYPFNREGE